MSKELENQTELPENLRISIEPYLTYYKQKLNELLDKSEQPIAQKYNDTINKDSRELTAEANAFSNQFFQFTNIVKQVHNNVSSESEQSLSYKGAVTDLLHYFNEKNAIHVSLNASTRRVFDKGHDVLNDVAANGESQKILKQYGIDFRILSNQLFNYLLIQKISRHFTFNWHSNDLAYLTFTEESKMFRLNVIQKFRPAEVEDLSDLADECLQLLKKNANQETRDYCLLTIFSNHQAETYERIKFNFRTIIERKDSGFSNQIFLILINLNQVKKLDEDLAAELTLIKGRRIDFNDKSFSSLLDMGWVTNLKGQPQSDNFKFFSLQAIGRALRGDFSKFNDQRIYLERPLDGSDLESFRFILLYMGIDPRTEIELQLSVEHQKNPYKFRIESGQEGVIRTQNHRDHFIARVPTVNSGDGWLIYKVDAQKIFDLGLGKDKMKLHRIISIRFSGSFTIGYISVHP